MPLLSSNLSEDVVSSGRKSGPKGTRDTGEAGGKPLSKGVNQIGADFSTILPRPTAV
jgi:hypothetical protein